MPEMPANNIILFDGTRVKAGDIKISRSTVPSSGTQMTPAVQKPSQVDTLTKDSHHHGMEDPEVRRIEALIQASNDRFDLKMQASNDAANARLELAFEKMSNKLDRVSSDVESIKTTIRTNAECMDRTMQVKLDAISGSLKSQVDDIRDSTKGLRSSIWLAALAAIALVVAILQYGAGNAGFGLTVRDKISESVKNAYQQERPLPVAPAKN